MNDQMVNRVYRVLTRYPNGIRRSDLTDVMGNESVSWSYSWVQVGRILTVLKSRQYVEDVRDPVDRRQVLWKVRQADVQNQERVDYRLEHFKVVLEPAVEPCEPGELTLRVTKNGTQWAEQLTLTPEERDQVWALLDAERRQRRGE